MVNKAKNVIVGKPKASGGAYHGPTGTVLPDDEDAALAAGLLAVGYISSDGVVQSIGTSTSGIIAWGGDKVREVQTEHDVTYALTMIETNGITAGVYYGTNNVMETAATVSAGTKLAIEITSEELPRGVWVFEIKDGLRTGRVVIPDGQVTERGDVSFIDEDAVSYPLTITAYPDENGVKAYQYWDDGVFAA